MKSFVIVQVDYEYCNFLRKYDKRVCYNYGEKRIRPFIGVLFVVDNIEYFAPLSSPKTKHKTMKNTLDFIKIKGGELGAINFNNMIPVSKEVYKKIDLAKDINDFDRKYFHLLKLQLLWLNRNFKSINKKAYTLYEKFINKSLTQSQLERCCNFSLLEEKCLEYHNKNYITNK